MSRKTGSVSHPMSSGKSRDAKKIEEAKEVVSGAQAMLEKLAQEDKEKKETPQYAPEELKDLKELILLGRVSSKVQFDGFEFELTTLRNSEKKAAVGRLSKIDSRDRPLFVRQFTLAYSIKSINGAPLESLYEMFCPDGETEDVIDQRVEILDEMQSVLVEALYLEYEKLVQQSINTFSDEEGEDKVKK